MSWTNRLYGVMVLRIYLLSDTYTRESVAHPTLEFGFICLHTKVSFTTFSQKHASQGETTLINVFLSGLGLLLYLGLRCFDSCGGSSFRYESSGRITLWSV